MTQYLSGKPFSVTTSAGKLSDEEYFIRVGAIVRCEACGKNVSSPHKCPKK
jgi:hypothetical protein